MVTDRGLPLPQLLCIYLFQGSAFSLPLTAYNNMEEFELEPGEEIIATVRQHPLVLLGKIIPALTSTAANIFAPALSITNGTVRFFLGIYWLFIWMSLFTKLTDYFLTAWIITTTRIVEIHQFGYFKRTVSSFLLIHVQDITTEIDGVFGTVFGFGKLNVETAGNSEKFVMYGLRGPNTVRDTIMREIALLHADGGGVPSLGS
jgi:hypothetical protein